jgi:DNA-binding XRE family transcriptional regulator
MVNAPGGGEIPPGATFAADLRPLRVHGTFVYQKPQAPLEVFPLVLVAQKKPVPTPFGRRLRQLREAAGLSLVQLGELVGMNWTAVRRLELSPSANPTLATLQKLATALGCTVADLVDGRAP